MASIDQLLAKLDLVDVEEIAGQALLLNKDYYLDLNTDQMWFGILKTGGPIAPPPMYPYPYSKITVEEKVRKGQPTDRVTLRDTDNFYNHMYLKLHSGGLIEIGSDVPYMQDIVDFYSDLVFGLFSESRELFITNAYQKTFVNLLKYSLDL